MVERLPRVQRQTSSPLPARARRAGPARCRLGPGGAGCAGGTQVPDALWAPSRAGALGGPRRVRRHVGAAGAADRLRGGPHSLRTSYRPRAASPRAAASRRRRAAATAASADRFHSRRCPAGATLPRRGTALPPPPLPPTAFTVDAAPPGDRRSRAGSCSTGGRTMAGSAATSPVSARAARSRTWWRTRARRQRCAARRTRCSTPPPTVPCGCCSLWRPLPASWPGLGPADPDPSFQFGRWLVIVWARPVGPDGCGPVTATGNRDNKEICSMPGPMSERAPDITVEADGRTVSTTVLADI
jgi:hypothetical protein